MVVVDQKNRSQKMSAEQSDVEDVPVDAETEEPNLSFTGLVGLTRGLTGC